jgi:hypothetical protein
MSEDQKATDEDIATELHKARQAFNRAAKRAVMLGLRVDADIIVQETVGYGSGAPTLMATVYRVVPSR